MLCKSLRVYEWLDQKWLSVHFLFLSKNDINSVLKIPVGNFCRITSQINPWHGRCVAQSCRHGRALVGLAPRTIPSLPNWNMKHYKSAEILSIFAMSSTTNTCKAALLTTFWRQFQWRSQLKNLGGSKKFWVTKMYDFRRITLFCLEKRLSNHKMTIFSKNLGGMDPFAGPWLRLWMVLVWPPEVSILCCL